GHAELAFGQVQVWQNKISKSADEHAPRENETDYYACPATLIGNRRQETVVEQNAQNEKRGRADRQKSERSKPGSHFRPLQPISSERWIKERNNYGANEYDFL